jgi:hypothetical protein
LSSFKTLFTAFQNQLRVLISFVVGVLVAGKGLKAELSVVYAFFGVRQVVTLIRASKDAQSTTADKQRQIIVLDEAMGDALGFTSALDVGGSLAVELVHLFVECIVDSRRVFVNVGHN